jgi:transcription elongation GreA/GreB family factor
MKGDAMTADQLHLILKNQRAILRAVMLLLEAGDQLEAPAITECQSQMAKTERAIRQLEQPRGAH